MNDKLETQRNRAVRAKALMEDPLIKEAFSALEGEYYEFWKKTPIRDQDARERIFHAIQVLGKVRGHLEIIIEDGKIANQRIAELNDKPKLKVV